MTKMAMGGTSILHGMREWFSPNYSPQVEQNKLSAIVSIDHISCGEEDLET